jgi:uncharacterized protein (TIGR03790 family)
MVAALCALSMIAPASLADRVLVVANADSPTSLAIAQEYVAKRGVKRQIKVRCADSAESAAKETITYASFREQIETPLRAYLTKHPEVDFIVLTKGIPIRIDGQCGLGISGARLSLDSYLACLDYDLKKPATKVTLTDTNFSGTAWANRYWNSNERFSHAKFGGYLVTRLDGYTEEDAKRLVTWSIVSEKQRPQGSILLDACPAFGFTDPSTEPVSAISAGPAGAQSVKELGYNHFNGDMKRAAGLPGLRMILDETDAFVSGQELLGYVSWGSNDSKFDAGNYKRLRFAPGGIAETAVSTSARTFLPTTGGQSLIADLISQRATGAKGYCDEPLLQAVASPSVLFDRYSRGWTLAESFYAASRFVGWEDVVVGDPICAPFKTKRARP